MNNVKLTPTQQAVLAHAIDHTNGHIIWFPSTVKGGARNKVLESLASHALIMCVDGNWSVSDAGYAAFARERPAQTVTTAARPGTKQAIVVALLQRPEGATIAQICEATGWQAHTVRGTFAGVIKKRLGLAITSDKPQGSERVYRIDRIPSNLTLL